MCPDVVRATSLKNIGEGECGVSKPSSEASNITAAMAPRIGKDESPGKTRLVKFLFMEYTKLASDLVIKKGEEFWW